MAEQNFMQALAQWLNQNTAFFSQTAVVATIIGVIVGAIQAAFGILKQGRENKVSRAKFGYELIDAIFTNEPVFKLLETIDISPSYIENIKKVLDPSPPNLNEEFQRVQSAIDWLLFYFDRVEHALSADLTRFEVIRMPIGYYVAILAKVKTELRAYTQRIGYDRVLRFLDRFESWRDKV